MNDIIKQEIKTIENAKDRTLIGVSQETIKYLLWKNHNMITLCHTCYKSLYPNEVLTIDNPASYCESCLDAVPHGKGHLLNRTIWENTHERLHQEASRIHP